MFQIHIAIDSHIGRFDASMLTQQHLMELFFTPDESDPQEYAEPRFLDDACSWKGVVCGAGGLVEEIEWVSYMLQIVGTIDFSKMPRSMVDINFFEVPLFGEVDTGALPDSLTSICLQDCKFTGSLNMSALPPKLVSFSVAGNRISAVGHISNLPDSLDELAINEVLVAHTYIHIGKLPDTDLVVFLYGGFTKVTFEDQSDARRVLYR